jgi:hypothetical protein
MSDMPAENEPLDPAAASALAKVRRLALIGGLTMMLGIGAIFAVIGYRVFKADGSAAPASAAVATPPDVAAVLPSGARVIGTAAGDGRLVVIIQIDGATELRLFDLDTLAPAGRLSLTQQP